MSRIQIHVAFHDRHYEVDANPPPVLRLSNPERDRFELFAEIDRSVAKVKAAIEAGA